MDDTPKSTEPVRAKTPEPVKQAKKEPPAKVPPDVEKPKAEKKPVKATSGVAFATAEGKGRAEHAPSGTSTKEVDVRRKSSWGTFNRVVTCAIDASVCARYAFESGIKPPVEEWKKSLDKMNVKMRKLEEEFEGECIKRKLKYKIRGESFKNPGEGICVISEDEQADLIVIGSRGVGAVKRALMGSVSEFVVRHAGIPCLVVRAKKLQ